MRIGRFAVLTLFTAACSSAYTPVPVKGVVTLDGQPVEGAVVHFLVPGEQTEGRPAFGTTDHEGRFRLSTLGREDGALPRDYRVVVFKYVPARPDVQIPAFPKTPKGKAEREDFLYKLYGDKPHTQNILPAKYADINTTPFQITVPTKGEVVLDLSST
jgi:hypothetical protein